MTFRIYTIHATQGREKLIETPSYSEAIKAFKPYVKLFKKRKYNHIELKEIKRHWLEGIETVSVLFDSTACIDVYSLMDRQKIKS